MCKRTAEVIDKPGRFPDPRQPGQGLSRVNETAPHARSVDAPTAGAGGLLLEMRGVCKQFGGTQALKDAALAVNAGEIVALLGENGAGKSTLIKILAGVYPLDAGSIATGARMRPTPRAICRSPSSIRISA